MESMAPNTSDKVGLCKKNTKYIPMQSNSKSSSDQPDLEALCSSNPYRTTTKKSTTYSKSCLICMKYGFVFVGLLLIILMVVLGINNVATNNGISLDTQSTERVQINYDNESLPETIERIFNITRPDDNFYNSTSEVEITIQPGETLNDMIRRVFNVSQSNNDNIASNISSRIVPTSRHIFNSLQEDSDKGGLWPNDSSSGEDVIVSNKTIIINGGNGSVVITN